MLNTLFHYSGCRYVIRIGTSATAMVLTHGNGISFGIDTGIST